MKFLTRLKGPFLEFGTLDGLLYLVDIALRRVSSGMALYVYEMMAQPVVEKPLLPARMASAFRAEEIGEHHADLAKMPVPQYVLALRFKQSARCLALYRDDQMVGYMWFCFGHYEEDEVRCTYELVRPHRSVFDFDLYLFPDHRMGVAFGAIWNAANQYLRNLDVTHSFSRMTRFNTASRRAHRRMGAVCVGRVWIVKIGRLEGALSTLPPYVSVSSSDSSRVRLRLPMPTVSASSNEDQV